jgi:hypothetical protein
MDAMEKSRPLVKPLEPDLLIAFSPLLAIFIIPTVWWVVIGFGAAFRVLKKRPISNASLNLATIAVVVNILLVGVHLVGVFSRFR